MSAMATQDTSNKRPPMAEGDQGESKKAAVGDTPGPTKSHKNPPTRRGIIVDLIVESADKFVDFVAKTMGAREYFRFAGENGKIMHLALDIDGIATYVEELGNNMDTGVVKTPHVRLHLNSDDPMSLAEKLMKAGAKELNKCEQQFWGATFGSYQDPYGLIWSVSNSSSGTLEDVPKELARKVIPFVCVRDATAFMTFLTETFDAEVVYPPAKDPTGKIMCAEMMVNGGIIMIGDHCGPDTGKHDPSVTISYEVGTGQAPPLAKAFKEHGGEVMEEPSMQFWGQVWGRCKDAFGQPWGLCEVQTAPTPSNEDMEVDMKIGAKFDWKYTWVEEDVPAMYCFGEARTCLAKAPQLAQEMKEMIPMAYAESAKTNMTPAGPCMAAYFTWDSAENGKARFTCGPTVAAEAAAAAAEPEGDGFGVRKVGGCKCVTVVHVGPYEEMMKTYMATFEWVGVKGYESRMPVMEVYENDPKEVEPAELRTKICIPIVPKPTSKN